MRDFMTGCLTISDDATVADAAEALARYRVLRSLWSVQATARRLAGSPSGDCSAGWDDRSLASAREATTEQATAIYLYERLRVALYALSPAGATRILGRRSHHQLAEGVIMDFDLAVAARR